jgi:hypothetical protein
VRTRKRSSDPYAKLECGGKTQTSPSIAGSVDPQWREDFRFRGTAGELSRLKLQLLSGGGSSFMADKKLGSASVGLAGLPHGEPHSYTLPLSTQGSVSVVVTWRSQDKSGSDLVAACEDWCSGVQRVREQVVKDMNNGMAEGAPLRHRAGLRRAMVTAKRSGDEEVAGRAYWDTIRSAANENRTHNLLVPTARTAC